MLREIALRASVATMAVVALFGFNPQALAASETWSGSGGNGNWSNTNNWVGGVAPGSTSSTSSADVAVFNAAIANGWGNSGTPVVIDSATQNIGGITFTGAAGNYTIGSTGGNSLLLSSAGNILLSSSLASTNAVETINAPLVLEGASGSYSFVNNSADGAGAGAGTLDFGGGITGVGAGATVLNLMGANTNGNTISGVIGNGSATTVAVTKAGSGTWNLTGANTYTGATTVSAGTLVLNFGGSGAPANNIVSSSSVLTMGGGTLQVNGASGVANNQTFASTAVTAGQSVISAAPSAGSMLPTVNLGALTMQGVAGAGVEFVGSATIGASNVAVPATGTITTTSSGSGVFGAYYNAANTSANVVQDGATVGLYDWASSDTTAGTAGASPYTIIGGSQVTGFYQTTGITTTTAAYDYNPSGDNTLGTAAGSPLVRFNYAGAATINTTATTANGIYGFLITPNVGANNDTLSGSGLEFGRFTSAVQAFGTIVQNNTLGYFEVALNLEGGREAAQNNGLVQAGAGTVVYTGSNAYEGATFLNGGYSVVIADNGFGNPADAGIQPSHAPVVSDVYLNGGTVVGNASFTMDNVGANKRPINLLGNGGGLAATAGNTMIIDGAVESAVANNLPLVIGIPASSANGNVAGLLPGSGAGTANTTAVMATGTVVLNGGNGYFGGTVIDSGVLNINGINALGGADYGGTTLNGGTLQYATGATGNGSLDLTSIGNAGVTLAAGGGTIDTNGNTVSYAGGVGGSGSGNLTVTDSVGTGSLALNGNNTFTGSVTVNSGASLAFGGSNLYSGATGVNGKLTLSQGASLGNTAITVGNAATLNASPTGNGNIAIGTTGGTLTLSGGSTLSLTAPAADSSDTLTLNSPGSGTGTVFTVGGASSAAILDFDLSNFGSNELVINDGTTAFGADGGEIVISAVGNDALLSSYTIISDPNGGLATGTGVGQYFELGTSQLVVNGTTYNLSLSTSTSTAEILSLSPVGGSPYYYWTGNTSASWSAANNFTTDQTGVLQQNYAPSAASNIFLTANSATHYSQTLDGNYTINSLSFTGTGTGAASNSITLTNSTLTIDATNSFTDAGSNTYTAGTGLVVQPGSAAHTIASNINLGSSQTWEINNSSANALTVSGVIGNAPGTGADSLIKTGPGGLTLTGSDTYSGGTTVNGGVLTINGSLPAGNAVIIGGASASGTPLLTGTGIINGSVTLASAGGGAAGIVDPGGVGAIGTLTVGSVTFNAGSMFDVDLGATGADELVITGAATIASGADISFNLLGTPTLGSYVLATAQSGLNSSAFTGTAPTNYRIIASGTTLDLTHEASQTLTGASPATINIITGATTLVSGTLTNTAPSGSSSLAVQLSDGGSTGGTLGSFTGTGPVAANNGTLTVGATLTAGAVGTGKTWSLANTDPNAITTTASTGGTINVYNHSSARLYAATGNNQSIITGGTFAGATAILDNTTATTGINVPAPLDVTAGSLSNLSGGATGSLAVGSNSSATYTASGFNNTTVGGGQTLAVGLTAGDSATVTGANALAALSGTFTYNVYAHATTNGFSGGTLSLGDIHQGYNGTVTATNSLTVTNGSAGDFRVALKGSGSQTGGTTTGLGLNTIGGGGALAAGNSANITASLGAGLGVGQIDQNFIYTFADDSSLSGAGVIGTAPITVTGQVYSGRMIWTGSNGSAWNTDANWNDSTSASVHAAPGLDRNFTGQDTATFGNTSGAVTVDLNSAAPSLNAMVFTGAGSYTIAQGSGSTGLTFAGSAPSITDSGTNGINTPVAIASNLTTTVSNSSDSLTISGAITDGGGGKSLTMAGAGTLILSGNNSYGGGTFVNSGVVQGNTSSLKGAISDNGSVVFDQAVDATFSGSLTGSGSLIKQNSGNLSISPGSGFSGAVSANGGTLTLGGALASTSYSANSGGLLDFNGNTVTIPYGSITANAGSTVEYTNSTVNGGYVLGSGTNLIPSAGLATFNGVTTYNSTDIQQNGAANLNNFTSGGALTNAANGLDWNGGTNTSSGRFNVNATAIVQNFSNTGFTTINNGGVLNNEGSGDLVSGGGSQITINNGGALNLQAGTALDLEGSLLVNNGTISGPTNVYYGATAIGSGTYGSLSVYTGGAYHPGNSPGVATVNGTLTLGPGGISDFELADATGGAGVGWDETVVSGADGFLDVTAGNTSNSRFTIDIISGTVEQEELAANFDDAQSYQWLMFTTSQGVTDFDPSDFTLNDAAFLNSLGGGSFAIAQQGNNVVLNFTPQPVPEPSTWAMMAAGLVSTLLIRRRRVRA